MSGEGSGQAPAECTQTVLRRGWKAWMSMARPTRRLLSARFWRSISQGTLVVDLALYLHALGWSGAAIGMVLSGGGLVGAGLNLVVGVTDDVDHDVARSLDMLGGMWGISNETGPYPGAWWLWPYTFFYQVPPMSSSTNGDLQVGVIILMLYLASLFTPFVAILTGRRVGSVSIS